MRWRAILGVACPVEADVTAPAPARALGAWRERRAAVGGRRAPGRPLRAAVELAVLEGALRRVEAELHATTLRRNAIEHRWIPAHEQALAALRADAGGARARGRGAHALGDGGAPGLAVRLTVLDLEAAQDRRAPHADPPTLRLDDVDAPNAAVALTDAHGEVAGRPGSRSYPRCATTRRREG